MNRGGAHYKSIAVLVLLLLLAAGLCSFVHNSPLNFAVPVLGFCFGLFLIAHAVPRSPEQAVAWSSDPFDPAVPDRAPPTLD